MYIHDLDLANQVIETLNARLDAIKAAAQGVFTHDPGARRLALQELHRLVATDGWPQETCTQCGLVIDRRTDGFGYHQGHLLCLDCNISPESPLPKTQNPEPKT